MSESGRVIVCKEVPGIMSLVQRFETREQKASFLEGVCRAGTACLDCGMYQVLRGDFEEIEDDRREGWRIWGM